MDKGTLVVDRNVNRDSSSDIYNRSEFTSVSVTVNNGTSITGTQAAQMGIAQKNYAGTSGNTTNANMQPYIVVKRWHRVA